MRVDSANRPEFETVCFFVFEKRQSEISEEERKEGKRREREEKGEKKVRRRVKGLGDGRGRGERAEYRQDFPLGNTNCTFTRVNPRLWRRDEIKKFVDIFSA